MNDGNDGLQGLCNDCGLPAAFWSPTVYGRFYIDVDGTMQGKKGKSGTLEPEDTEKFCAVCAANHAAEGEEIRRIKELV